MTALLGYMAATEHLKGAFSDVSPHPHNVKDSLLWWTGNRSMTMAQETKLINTPYAQDLAHLYTNATIPYHTNDSAARATVGSDTAQQDHEDPRTSYL